MINTLKHQLFIALSALVLVPQLGLGSSGTESAAFLDIPVGAGPAAVGSAYSASAQDAYAPIYNPAGLASLPGPEMAAQYLSYLQSINYEFGSFVMPLNGSHDEPATRGIGGAIQYLGSGDIAGTDPNGNPTGSYSSYYAAYSLSYGQKVIDKLSLGLTGKIITGKIADASASAYAADLGALYQQNSHLAFSATVNNLGSGLKFVSQDDSLPLAFHLGSAYEWTPQFRGMVEGVYDKTGLFSAHVGGEWNPLDAISIRTGYRTDTTRELSAMAGLTVGIGIHFFGQEFSYAWLPYGDLGETNYFSLVIHFGEPSEQKRNLIQYRSIKIHDSASHPNDLQRQDTSSQEPDSQQLMELLDNSGEHMANSQNTPPPSNP